MTLMLKAVVASGFHVAPKPKVGAVPVNDCSSVMVIGSGTGSGTAGVVGDVAGDVELVGAGIALGVAGTTVVNVLSLLRISTPTLANRLVFGL